MKRVYRAWRSLGRARQVVAVLALALAGLQSVVLTSVGMGVWVPLVMLLLLVALVLIKHSSAVKMSLHRLTAGSMSVARVSSTMQSRLSELERLQSDSRRAVGLLREHLGRTDAQFQWLAEHANRRDVEDAELRATVRRVGESVEGACAGAASLSELAPQILEALEQVNAALLEINAHDNEREHGLLLADESSRDVERAMAELRARADALGELEQSVVGPLQSLRSDLATALDSGNSHSIERRVIAEMSALLLLQGVRDGVDMPPITGWAVAPLTLQRIQAEATRVDPGTTIIELGSGVSTVWIAHALQQLDDPPRFISVEHDEKYAAETRQWLTRLNLDRYVELVEAPIQPIRIAGDTHPWYATDWLNGVEKVSLLVVDGPPAATAPGARYPAVPLLSARLSEAALIIVDDADRPDEKEMIRRWAFEHPGIREVSAVGRSKVLRYSRETERGE